MLRDEEIQAAIDAGIAECRRHRTMVRGQMMMPEDDPYVCVARAVEQAAYAAAIKAIEATKIDEDDLVEEIDREVNRTIDNCIDAIRDLMQEQPK